MHAELSVGAIAGIFVSTIVLLLGIAIVVIAVGVIAYCCKHYMMVDLTQRPITFVFHFMVE